MSEKERAAMESGEQAVRDYLARVSAIYAAGNATEHSYRPALQKLLEAIGEKITATNEPKRIACGAPDFAISRPSASGPRTIGYVEAKDVGVSLDETLRTDQLHRYLASLDNLILTDYLEFRWFTRQDGEMKERTQTRARIATLKPGRKLERDDAGVTKAASMLTSMLGQGAPRITSPRDLAERMARMAHMIRNVALETLGARFDMLSGEDAATVRRAQTALTDLLETFRKTLLPELKEGEFADMFAQTLAYGLFAARYNHSGPQAFNRHDAAREIPRSNPFLRNLFNAIESPDLEDAPYVGFVDDLAQLLAEADMDAILRDFGKRTRTEDPIVHFYETFLAAYDPKLRELRGVYYTPEPVVSYIVRSVDAILKDKKNFDLPDGLASDRGASPLTPLPGGEGNMRQPLTILDPACGTGTFLYATVNHIRDRFIAQNNAGAWPGYVRERLLPRLFGFELLMAPYAMAHLKLGMQLAALDLDLPEAERARWAVHTGESERTGVYLTNTLDLAAHISERILMGQFITDEANAADDVKRDKPVMVVLGNPPYSGHSANKGPWIASLLRGEDRTNNQGRTILDSGKGRPTANYFMVDGKPLGERNPKWLNDDYVKFIRFAQWRIERTGHGVLAFVTNHGYLDNPTFRGMRQSLMRAFDEIYVLDLHGNSKKKERTPEGGKDENVFDIQQGVAIGLFIRRRGQATGDRSARVYHADLYGERAGKYDWLTEQDVASTEWTEVTPQGPMYFFFPRNEGLAEEYERGWSITNIAPVNGVGITTARDGVVIDHEKSPLVRRAKIFRDSPLSDEDVCRELGIAQKLGWNIASARKLIRQEANLDQFVKPILYRAFDERFIFYHDSMVWRTVKQVMGHMIAGRNLGIITRRQMLPSQPCTYFGITRRMISDGVIRSDNHGSESLFPLYLYPDPSKPDLWGEEEAASSGPGGRRANLAPGFVAEMAERLGLGWVADGRGDRVATFGPEDVFSYIYAIFHAPSYRARYADFLKSDFPRVPLTSNVALFRDLAALGDRLVALHLLEAEGDPAGRPSYPVGGDNRVEQVRYVEPNEAQGWRGRVYINATQYFDGVEPEVWEFHIGGYQVAEKWLKDRKGRSLSYDDIEHYQKTIAALAETAGLMERVDEAIEEAGGWPLG